MSLSSSLFNRPHFCLQFSAPIDSPRPVFPPPPVERNTFDLSRNTKIQRPIGEIDANNSANLATSKTSTIKSPITSGRPPTTVSRLPALDELPQVTPRNRNDHAGRAADGGGRRGRLPPPVPPSDQTQTPSTLHSTPPQDTARLGWWLGIGVCDFPGCVL